MTFANLERLLQLRLHHCSEVHGCYALIKPFVRLFEIVRNDCFLGFGTIVCERKQESATWQADGLTGVGLGRNIKTRFLLN